MAVVELPSGGGLPWLMQMDPVLIDFGGVQVGSTGGAAQSIDRLGSRWRFACSMPPMPFTDYGRTFCARLVRAKRLGLRIDLPLAEGNQGAPGTGVVVNLAGQSGAALAVRGGVPGYVAKEGYWLSIVKDGQHFAHQLSGTVTFGGDGKAVLPIEPMLRVPFPDGAAVHLAAPKVEGFVVGNEMGWSIDVAQFAGLAWTLEEYQ